MQKKLMFGIEDEFEGHGTLWFEMENREQPLAYVDDNLERGQIYKFQLKEMTQAEVDELNEE